MTLDGEITEIASPPNKADRFKNVTVWIPITEEHAEITFPVEDFQKMDLNEGDKITKDSDVVWSDKIKAKTERGWGLMKLLILIGSVNNKYCESDNEYYDDDL